MPPEQTPLRPLNPLPNPIGQQKTNQFAKFVLGVVVVGAISLGVLLYVFTKRDDTTSTLAGDQSATTPTSLPAQETSQLTTSAPATTKGTGSSVTTTTPPPATSSIYRDGSYSAEGSYDSPAGMETIKVTLALKKGVVSDANVVNEARDRTSSKYQNMFISGYKQFVVGKDINSIHLNKVSGSSLTGAGFNKALESIKSQAKA